jgi:uncharacterized OsmC-like protein
MQSTMNTHTRPMIHQPNGIDRDALVACIDAITEDASQGMTTWRVSSRWVGGTRSDHRVDGFSIGGRQVRRPFTLKVDEPEELCGTNEFPNPQEYFFSAVNACMMVGYSAVATLMGIRLTMLEIETTGDIDLRGFLGIDDSVTRGCDQLRQTVRIAGEATEEQFAELHRVVLATSPNFDHVTRAVPMKSRLEVVMQDA